MYKRIHCTVSIARRMSRGYKKTYAWAVFVCSMAQDGLDSELEQALVQSPGIYFWYWGKRLDRE